MADENLIQQVQKMLQEEKWTRETINNYTENKFKELSQIVENAKSSESTYDLLSLADEHLSHTKDSIIALYISGMLSLSQNNLDNSSLENLIDIFQKNHKENIVIHLCQTILDHDSNNKFALRTLAEIYNTNGDERVWALYEKIVKLDFAEAEMAKKLAEHYEKSSPENSIEYYKKAHLRYISAKNTSALKETWSRLVSLAPEDIDFFMLSKRKIAKTINENQTSVLLRELYEWYKKEKKWDTAIDLIKQDLEIEPSQWGRKELASCYRGKYEGKSHLEEYIKLSNLTSNFRNVFEAINDFEKHISFDAKNFVFHRTWGIGIIKEVANDTLTINFGKKHGKKSMALKMAVEALTPLSKDHIWVLKATKSKDELAKMVKKDKTWALKTIIKSFDNSCDFKRIKAELVPAVLSQGEWTSWSNSAKKTLESDSTFGVELSDINSYTVRDHDVSKDMKLINEFKAQKQFFARIDILMKYINEEETDKTSDSFGEMFSYFTGFLKSISKINEQTVAAYLTVQNINKTYPEIAHPIKFTFQDLYKRIESPREMYNKLKDTKNTTLKEDFIAAIRMLPDWDKQYTYLFPEVLKEKLLTTLINEGKKDQVIKLAQNCFENYKDNREAVIFLFKECQEKDWFKDALIPYEKRLIALANIIELTFKEINNHVNSTENKKINKVATDLLFKKETLITYMLENDEDTVKRMYTL
ncbi:MAG: transcription elongation factor GreA, partial [Treponema sp.]|nr:transcription elongation factor GreA [Treponema sp.]